MGDVQGRSVSAFRLIIPTRDSSAWLGIFLAAYRTLGIEPFYIVDARSDAATFDVLREQSADWTAFTPAGDFVEAGMIEFGSRHAGTKWVLRLDDDEFPTAALLRWVADVGIASRNQAVALSRRELFLHLGEIWYSRSPGRFPHAQAPRYLHPQVRLHHVDRVRYVHNLHTHGFDDLVLVSLAPESAYFVHLNCLLRTPAERWAKLQRYEAMRPRSAEGLGDEYLPELFDFAHHDGRRDGLQEFAPLFAALPIQRDAPPPDLDSASRTMLIDQVHRREDDLRAAAHGQHPLLTADDLRSLRVLPRVLWRPLAAALRTAGPRSSRLRQIGDVIRNYARIERAAPRSPGS